MRIVDVLDEINNNGKPMDEYFFWPDVQVGNRVTMRKKFTFNTLSPMLLGGLEGYVCEDSICGGHGWLLPRDQSPSGEIHSQASARISSVVTVVAGQREVFICHHRLVILRQTQGGY